ncbi:MAG: hypothetical protein IJY08_06460 [Clostridia bacterium]|nr:hypothetical protein [Clostridia bacterium]
MKTKLISLILSVVMIMSAFGMMSVSAETTAECYWTVDGSETVNYGTFAQAVTAANAVSANGAITITLQNDVYNASKTEYCFNIAEGAVATVTTADGTQKIGGFSGIVSDGKHNGVSGTHSGTVVLDGITMEHNDTTGKLPPFINSRSKTTGKMIVNNCTFKSGADVTHDWMYIGLQYSEGYLEMNNCVIEAQGQTACSTWNEYETAGGVFCFYDSNATIILNGVTVNASNNTAPFVKANSKKTITPNISLCNVTYDGASGDFNTNNAISMINGASVRTVAGSDGIRFSSNISKAAIEASADSYEMGTSFYTGNAVDASKLIGTLTAKDGIVDNSDGSKRINAVLSGITDMAAEYSAQSFIKYTKDSVNVTIYSKFDTQHNTRSMAVVANAALKDLSDTQTGIYQYAVTVGGATKYSPYSAPQYAVINNYVN